MYPIKIDKLFDEYRDFFNTSLMSLWAVCQEPFLTWVERQQPNIMSLESSIGLPSAIHIQPVVNQIRRSNLPNDLKGPLHTELIRKYCSLFCITVFEILKEDSRYQQVSEQPVIQFLRHIRNGCAHNNKFYLKHGEPRYPAKFRSKTIEKSLQGREVLFSYLSPGDIPYLLEDVSKVLSVVTNH